MKELPGGYALKLKTWALDAESAQEELRESLKVFFQDNNDAEDDIKEKQAEVERVRAQLQSAEKGLEDAVSHKGHMRKQTTELQLTLQRNELFKRVLDSASEVLHGIRSMRPAYESFSKSPRKKARLWSESSRRRLSKAVKLSASEAETEKRIRTRSGR